MKSKHLLLIVGSLVLLALIYFAPKTALKDTTEVEAEMPKQGFDFPNFIDSLTTTLLPKDQEKLNDLVSHLGDDPSLLDSIIKKWDYFRQPLVSAYYAKSKASREQTSEEWFNAGDRFLTASRITKDARLKKVTYENAISSFENSLELNAKNLDAKSGLGVCFVESAQITGQPPMKGIGLLKEVLVEDSTNINALINLGYYSLQSGQLELAIDRFKKVLEIDSKFHEAYLYLAEISQRQDNKEEAIIYLETYRDNIDNQAMVAEIDRYIQELKTN